MAKLSRDDVLKLARLARLQLSDDEIDRFVTEISEILQYVDQLQEVDLSGMEPTSQVTGLTNVERPDEIKDYGVTAAFSNSRLAAARSIWAVRSLIR